MKYKGVKTLEVLEGADNYNNWIASSIARYIKSPVLEIGAGTGNISSYFTSFEDLTLTDIDPRLVEKLAKRFQNYKNVNVEILDISSRIHTPKNKFKSIYSVNVLEHIRDDKIALLNMNFLLDRGGRVILLVPAKKYAYNKLDQSLGHYRRYEKRELKKRMEEANFEVEYIEYFNVLGLLSWVIREKISRDNNHLRPYQVKIFDLLVPVLKAIEPKRGLPFGISLIVVGKKA